MRIIKILLLTLFTFNLTFASSKIDLNSMYLTNFITIVANSVNKNIILNTNLEGELNFQLKHKLSKDELYILLIDILKTRGYRIEEKNLGYLELVSTKERVNSNNKLITTVIEVKPKTIEESISNTAHLLSKDGKMVVNRDLNLMIFSEYFENLQTIKKIVGSIQNEDEVIAEFINLKYAKTSDVIENLKKLLNLLFRDEKVEIIGDEIRNSIILISARKNIYKLKPYIKRFDVVNRVTTKKVKVFSLKSLNHNRALDILNSIFPKNEDIKITSDSSSNSIIVFASERELQYIEDILFNLDKQREQVYIKVKILEINEDRWSSFKEKYKLLNNPSLSGNDFVNLNLLITKRVINEIASYSSKAKLYDVESLISNRDLNNSKENLNIPQSYLLASSLSLLNLANAIDIVSEPTMLSLSNEEVLIDIHKIENSDTFDKIGVKLKIIPRVLNDKRVKLEVSIKFKNKIESKSETRDINTNVVLGDSESLIVNGLKSDFIEKSFFDISDRKNLMIILTPYILGKEQSITEFEEELSHLNKLESEYAQRVINLLKSIKRESRENYYDIFKLDTP